MNFLSLALLSTGAFVSTNIDDLFLLVGFFSDRSFSRLHIFAGQILGMAAIVAIKLGGCIGGSSDLARACGLARPRTHRHRSRKAIAPREER